MTTLRARPPAPLPGRARAMLAAYREAHEISLEAEDRIWSVVGKDDAPEPAFDPLAEPELAPRTDRRWMTYAGASLAAAAVLVLAWRMGGTIAERREAERTPGAAVMQGGGSPSEGHAVTPSPRTATPKTRDPAPATEPAPTDDPPTTATPTPITEPSEPELTEPEPPSPSVRPRPSSSTPAERSSPPSTDPAPDLATPSTFAAERELVAQAWRALALGDHAQALQAAAEHTRRFPAGLLVPERAAIETIAHCRQDPEDGPRRASAFHRAHPRSPLAGRVDEACEKKSTAP